MTTNLMSSGISCYINSVLQAWIWTLLLTTELKFDTWDAWTQSILCIFTTHAGEVIFHAIVLI